MSSEPPTSFLRSLADHVAQRPDAVAVVAGGVSLTYAELWARSAGVAARLAQLLEDDGKPVAILAGHDTEAVVGFVAAAMSRRPSVMLDAVTPVERMRTICQIAGLGATLVGSGGHAEIAASIGPSTSEVVALGEVEPDRSRAPHADPVPEGSILNLVFTSGSTGVPKGVALPDVAFTTECTIPVDAESDARLGCPAPLSFIMGSGGVTRALALGAELHLFDPRRAGIAAMPAWVDDNRITYLSVTPHIMRSLAKAANDQEVVLGSLRLVASGGEALFVDDVHELRRCTTHDCIVVNAAGSSEGWGFASLPIPWDHPLPAAGIVPAGHPAADRDVFLVDEHLERITDRTQPGQIVVAAEHMAAGYWNLPQLTSERFIRLDDGRRAYLTGDIGRWNENDELELAGRADHMLKIRGYLVEPAEIETHALAKNELVECVVVGSPGAVEGSTRLVAYVVPRASTWISAAELSRRLRRELPSYMVPTRIVELTALPRNPNGKIDRLRLPDAPPPRETQGGDPQMTSLHDAIAQICADALGIESVGKFDDLFDLGADSLAVEEIVAALDDQLHIQVTSATLMDNPTVAALAELPRDHSTDLVDGVAVPLYTGTSDEAPVFFVAGAGGLAFGFRSLVQLLGTERSIYGLQAHGIEGPGLPDLTFHRTVRRYVHAIRHVSPDGPYTVLGHSLGAYLAYAIVRDLVQAGATVRLLGLIDPVGDPRLDSGPVFMRNQQHLSDDDGAPEAQAGALGADPAPVGRLRQARERLRHDRPYLTRSFWRTYRDRPFVAHWELGQAIARHFDPSVGGLQGVPTCVYLASDQMFGAEPQGIDWDRYISPAPRTVTVSGDHLTMLRPPFVEELAGVVRADLSMAS